ncbi:DUF3892 domain-containing protein [Clostridium sp.]|uniref:DUF3892 domain-containing protein n=1 Tax=Clostridium sp. TaxID=1506 RepID=UPI002FC8612A
MKDQMNDNMIGNLPKNINKASAAPKEDAEEITKVVKQGGRVVGYELSNGHQIDKNAAVQMAKDGEIKGVGVGVSKTGEEYVRSLPDDTEANNLSSLPVITIHS